MITSVADFLRYFAGVNRRAVRDIGALPPQAEGWAPPSGSGEQAWSIAEIVGHMGASRLFFAHAFNGEGWQPQPWPGVLRTVTDWAHALTESADQLGDIVAGAGDGRLSARVAPLDPGDHAISGWRVLMLMAEHDIHHRSQIDAYAGVMGWPVEHIFGRSAEDAGLTAAPRRSRRAAARPPEIPGTRRS